jgi:glycerol-3-phosphate cytidylyltransferase
MGLRLYTGGTFDLFHAGHVKFLKRCSEIADEVIVSLNTDEFISAYKGKPPIINYMDRKDVLLSCKYVDRVIPNMGGADSKQAIEYAQPNIVAIGSDWARRDYYQQMQFSQDWLDANNISLIYIPYTSGISSTEIKKRLSG